MGNFAKSLRRIRFEKRMTQEEFATFLGTTKQNISRYESGAVSPKITTAQMMANRLGVTLSELNGEDFDDDERKGGLAIVDMRSGPSLPPAIKQISDLHMQRVPLLGNVAAGEPIYTPEDAEVYVTSPVACDAALTVQGDSMEPTYLDGDLLYIKCVPDVAEGRIAVVFLDDECAVKHVYKRPTGLTLISDNPAYPPRLIEFDDYANVRIFGVPMGFTRMFKKDFKRSSR